MGQYTIKMPDIGEGIAEVELVEWRVRPGDAVAEDQVLADVMTDKATVEIPSPVAGTVLELGGQPGELMAVGAELIRLEVQGEGNVKAQAVAAASAAGAREAMVSREGAPALPPADKGSGAPRSVQPANPVPAATAQPIQRAPGERPIASPAVRSRAWELGIELRFVHGSGPAGRITHEDLDVYLASRGQSSVASRPESAWAQRHGEEAIPVIGLRRRIAQKMQEAKRRIPHFSYVEEVDVTELEALRAALNKRYAAGRGKLTLLPLLARAVVLAVADFPQMNARFDDDAGVVTRHAPVHLGMATQTDAGLLVPVIRHAEALDPWACAREIARLAQAARDGKASRDELGGSTLTISSLGPLGGIVTTPVINHPEVAIIGVNRIVERPVLRGGAVVARQLMNLSSSFDHRVVDGMEAAQFIQAIRALLETPALLFVE
ncbi:dihydrolipoamide acetyltransferase family protein [Ramlibacter tataouinensis]|uniref:Dihydrolipoamide acetyltransferase component of pyruvate dehydrogenase complex n=1 Tax=Ramlibacter tataouinensis (strain ATCC BAA-407 / DSM 14655 / LMG 21543 / TTB310) TaxID=365046 RepID=F5Y0B3_RAMTT|nr:dihydrolipoamide acetyltransferase family protein [Ramlibacter tataouinensis]AEG92135.1 Candidate Lipoamide acyltransferase component of branched-chain alpha-keto acid dehydrogenase complex [Ramlibacter tataouinensis TTB310]